MLPRLATRWTRCADLNEGDGRRHVFSRRVVVEFDEGGWLGVEANGYAKTAIGGTVSACSVSTGSCSVLASGLSLPTTLTFDRDGGLWVAEHQPMLFAAAGVRRIQ